MFPNAREHLRTDVGGGRWIRTHVTVRDNSERRFLAKTVKIGNSLHGRWVLSAGAPGEIRTPDPQIRSLGAMLIIPGYVELWL
jgi:hypothetical protein